MESGMPPAIHPSHCSTTARSRSVAIFSFLVRVSHAIIVQISTFYDQRSVGRFEFHHGRALRTHIPPEFSLLPDYGNLTAAQELIDQDISVHDCIKWIQSSWSWRCGVARLGLRLIGRDFKRIRF
jgi:hypothetical protein